MPKNALISPGGSEPYGTVLLDHNEQHVLTTDEHGLVDKQTMLESLHLAGFSCDCSGSHGMNFHHTIFDARDVDRFIGGIDEDEQREVYAFFYRSLFVGFHMPVCAHDVVQDITHSVGFPEYEVLRSIKIAFTALSVYQNTLRKLLNDHHELTTNRGINTKRSPGQMIKDAQHLPMEQREKALERARFIAEQMENKTNGRVKGKKELKQLLSPNNVFVTPENLTKSGSFTGLFEELLTSRRISYQEVYEATGRLGVHGLLLSP